MLSGRTGQILVQGYAKDQTEWIGIMSLDGIGDIDGDGVPDFAVAGNAVGFAGLVAAFSGKTGQRLFTWRDDRRSMAAVVAQVRGGGIDVDLDGVPDMLASSVADGVYAFSGRDGSVLMHMPEQPIGVGRQGFFLATLPPQPTSPFWLFAVEERSLYASTTLVGKLSLVRAAPRLGGRVRRRLPRLDGGGAADRRG